MAEKGTAATETCSYARSDGSRCPGVVEDRERGLCFWHDIDISKEGPDVRKRLEAWAEKGQSMEGFQLRYAALEGLKLSDKRNRDLRRANLFRANLQGASLFSVDLRSSELLKANLAGANLNDALLQDVELLGVNLDGARLERVEWGEHCINEQLAIQAERGGDRDESREKFKEAEEVYRTLRRAYAARTEPRLAAPPDAPLVGQPRLVQAGRPDLCLWGEPSAGDHIRSCFQSDLCSLVLLRRRHGSRRASEVQPRRRSGDQCRALLRVCVLQHRDLHHAWVQR